MVAMCMHKPDLKHWRPYILLLAPFKSLAQDPSFSSLIEFLSMLSRSGLLILGQAAIGDHLPAVDRSSIDGLERSGDASPRRTARDDVRTAIPSFSGFVQISCAPTGRLACYNLVMGAGLGSMVPDCIVMPLLSVSEATRELSSEPCPAFKPPVACAEEFVHVVCDTLGLRKNLLLAANLQRGRGTPWTDPGRIDLWVPWDFFMPSLPKGSGTEEQLSGDNKNQADLMAHLSLILQLGHLASEQTSFQQHVRLITSAPRGSSKSDELVASMDVQLRCWLQWARIRHGEAQVVTDDDEDLPHMEGQAGEMLAEPTAAAAAATLRHTCWLNQQMRKHSSNAAVLFMLLPSFFEISTTSPDLLVRQLCELVTGLPPTMLVLNGQGSQVISTTI